MQAWYWYCLVVPTVSSLKENQVLLWTLDTGNGQINLSIVLSFFHYAPLFEISESLTLNKRSALSHGYTALLLFLPFSYIAAGRTSKLYKFKETFKET